VARSDLVFPGAGVLGPSIPTGNGDALYPDSPLRYYPDLASAGERAAWDDTFAPVTAP
jgi:hypothetical protein